MWIKLAELKSICNDRLTAPGSDPGPHLYSADVLELIAWAERALAMLEGFRDIYVIRSDEVAAVNALIVELKGK